MRNLNEFLDARERPFGRLPSRRSSRRSSSVALTFDVARGTYYPRLQIQREPGFGFMEAFHPVRAADWILRERPPGPIAHHMSDGGFLIQRLHPHYPVMVDGRLEVFGPDKFVELQISGSDRFKELDAEYRFGVVVLHYSLVNHRDLLPWLYYNSNWQLVFADEIAVVFTGFPRARWRRTSSTWTTRTSSRPSTARTRRPP